MAEDPQNPNLLALPDAARYLRVSVLALRSLIDAGFLRETPAGIPMAELKSFSARNADGGAGADMSSVAEPSDPQVVMDALDKRTDELAQQAYDRFVRVIPDARQWTPEQRDTFIDQAKGRFGAILAVMSQGTQVDQTLRRDLEEVGAAAAYAGTSLPHLLLVLRISRDLMLQGALRTAQNNRVTPAITAFLARLLPSIDRLTDALAEGFWNAKLDQQQEEWHRLANILEASPYGAYEADLDGVIAYANPALGQMLGMSVDALLDRPLSEVVLDADGNPVGALLAEAPNDAAHTQFVLRGHEASFPVEVHTMIRRIDNEIVGFGGIVRRFTPELETANGSGGSADTSVLIPMIEELHKSLKTLADAGAFLDRNAEKMTVERIHQAGVSIRRQSERLDHVTAQLDTERRRLSE